MKNFLISLNGWQRIFVFVVIFLYLPVTIIALTEVKDTYELKYSNEQLNKQLIEYLQKENITLKTTIKIQQKISESNYKDAPLADSKNIVNENLIKVEFITSDKERKYFVAFDYLKNHKFLNDDEEIKKVSDYLQKLFDNNKVQVTSTFEYVKVLLFFLLTTLFTYFVGFMIGWVYKGFKK